MDPKLSPSIEALPSLEEALQIAWRQMSDGVESARHPFHQTILATVGENGPPQSRVVTVRQVTPEKLIIGFNIDIRSPKSIQLQRQQKASLLYYSKQLKTQTRLVVDTEIHHKDSIAREFWDASPIRCKRTYLTTGIPGDILDEPTTHFREEYRESNPDHDEAEPAYVNFAHVRCIVKEMDWVWLSYQGHVRAHFIWENHKLTSSQWLHP